MFNILNMKHFCVFIVEANKLQLSLFIIVSANCLSFRQLRDLAGMSCDPNLAQFVESSQSPTRKYNRVFFWEIVEQSRCRYYHLSKPEQTWREGLRSKGEGIIGNIKLAVVPDTVYRSYVVYSSCRR